MTDLRDTLRIGQGCSYSVGSERYPATIVGITAKSVTVQADDFTAAPGHDSYGTQRWEFSPNTSSKAMTFRLNKHGSLSHGDAYYLDVERGRRAYQDPDF
jgi:hypothetical protein